jgi:[acyl-carrier-protein] S-malonyltransferase
MSKTNRSDLREDCVVLFPGQGSLSGGAGHPWRGAASWKIVDLISDVSEMNVAHLLLDADDDEVIRTDRAQIATFALSLVGYFALLEREIRPKYFLGHSLGEFSALVASGLLSLEDGAALIKVRGAAMSRAAAQNPGSMVALMGGDDGARDALATLDDVWIANVNGTGQIVVSGTTSGLERLLATHRDLGWRRATPLAVGGGFHSPLMADAQVELDDALARVTWGTTDATLIANVDAQVHNDATQWRQLLSRQLTSPVEFLDATLALPSSVTTTIEMPPSGILTGLTKRIRLFEHQFAPSSLQELQEISL